jgi:DNA polymerase-3 subunit epsilon
MSENFYTHRIILIERAESSGNGSTGTKYPMWRCQFDGGKKANIMKHPKSDIDSYEMFKDYHAELDAMEIGEVVTWQQHPIEVRCKPSGQWLNFVTVAPRPDDAKPDEDIDMTEAQKLSRAGITEWAQDFINARETRILDIEASDKTVISEVLSISILDSSGNTLLKTLVKPTVEGFINHAEHINGITAEMLKDAPTLEDLYPQLYHFLTGMIVCAYNVDFDVPLLQNAVIRAGKRSIPILATVCAMKQFAAYRADWNFAKSEWRWATLSDAAAIFGIETPDAHDAEADCKTTLEIIKYMANGQPIGDVEPF